MVISVKIRNFSRSWMTKRTSPLESSNSETVRIYMFFEATSVMLDTWHILSGSQCATCQVWNEST